MSRKNDSQRVRNVLYKELEDASSTRVQPILREAGSGTHFVRHLSRSVVKFIADLTSSSGSRKQEYAVIRIKKGYLFISIITAIL